VGVSASVAGGAAKIASDPTSRGTNTSETRRRHRRMVGLLIDVSLSYPRDGVTLSP
jgi:hypothetical protein